ncbi:MULTISPECIES: ammonium transporter [unclassified Lentimonas]|uniref:ammonium transporter n=1 Tax=unclassified Lentimonas TaxID=2630993 RepID=UPI0013239DC9|nr:MULTISPECIES: ammonium transporter [unclassified Lentimonas]CAA6689606.1 Ammonium transporter [Lentimonas sp. CC10]CAA6691912.1 Ammonium transporter [Lentimonas sp. CC19]CAA7072169.1 Ammonium transporter [Lentimonas sp. CC11]
MKIKKNLLALLLGSSALLLAGTLGAQELPVEEAAEVVEAVADAIPFEDGYAAFMESPGAAFFTISNLWLLLSAALVFIMHLGFATVESGLSQSKNTVNILFKNVFIISMGLLTYAFWGFNAMYPDGAWAIDGFFAMGSWFDLEPSVAKMTAEYADYTWYTDFIFQGMFAATAATIVSGAVAERVKLTSFMIFATILVAFIYPITGSWQWGGGWLAERGFYDFAGSSLVHAFGGFAALACVLVLGPRAGKYVNGQIRPILGHSMPLATIGVFLLFLGWFGFNGGSVLNADPFLVSLVFVTTALAAAGGAMGAIFTSWIFLKKPDLSMALNGILAGLVGITAGADAISPACSILVGLIAGILVVFSIIFFDKIKIDDPVGAISVHGVCGVFGTLAVAIFGDAAGFGIQLIGTLSVGAFAFVLSFAVFGLLKVVMGVRVSPEEEAEGLDIGEHGQEAYPDFSGARTR